MTPVILASALALLAAGCAATAARAHLRARRLDERLEERCRDLERSEKLLSEVSEELAAMLVERERRGRWLEEARAKSEAADRAKSRFLAVMSHELKTPLNSVIGFANQLLKNKHGRLSEQELGYVMGISRGGARLLALVDRILDLSALEAGELDFDRVEGRMDAVVREALAEVEGAALDGGIELVAEVPGRLRPLLIDATRLRQVLVQLLDNAVKFTHAGRVRVVVRADAEGRPLAIEVIDQGSGIPPARLASIFEAFKQMDDSAARRYEGFGIGLTLAKRLCDVMGFGLEVESEVGRGSTFRVVLPSGPRAADHHDGAPRVVSGELEGRREA